MKTKTTQKEMVCIHCHQDLQQKSFIKINGDYICMDCLVKNYFYCDNCRTWHLKTSEKTKIGALYFCENCKRMGIIRKCETCGTWHLTSDLKKVFDKYFCDKCFKHKDTIKGYHRNPEPLIFHGEDAFYFGIELENCNENKLTWDEHQFVAGEIIDLIGKEHLHCEEDGSLRRKGFEIITQPHTMAEFEKIDFSRVCDTLKYFNYSDKSDLPGLHIHFSRDYLNSDQTLLLTYFYSKYYDNFKKLSGRITENSAYQWAAPNITIHGINSIDEISDDLKLQAIKSYFSYSSDRYLAVNLNNEKTIEFRLGAGTTNYNKIKLWIDLHFTIFKNAKNININNVNDLKTWFSGRDDLLATFKGV